MSQLTRTSPVIDVSSSFASSNSDQSLDGDFGRLIFSKSVSTGGTARTLYDSVYATGRAHRPSGISDSDREARDIHPEAGGQDELPIWHRVADSRGRSRR